MSVLKGTLIGFSYGVPGNLIHSSELGIMRVSEGNRYNDNLLPTAQEKTTQVPGDDGTYYFGTYYTQKSFSLSIAFDEVNDSQLRRMRKLFGEKGLHQLIFDEMPYKIYNVKVSGSPNFKYIAFDQEELGAEFDYSADLYGRYGETGSDNGDFYQGPPIHVPTKRVYKGEATINFIAYTPFAHSRYKYSDQYTVENIPEWGDLTQYGASAIYENIEEWGYSVPLIRSDYSLESQGIEYIIDQPGWHNVLVYNPGDFETPFVFTVKNEGTIPEFNIFTPDLDKSLYISEIPLATGDAGYRINTKLHLIEGIDSNGNVTGTIYNRYIGGGDFFSIPILSEPALMEYHCNPDLTSDAFSISYDYLFF